MNKIMRIGVFVSLCMIAFISGTASAQCEAEYQRGFQEGTQKCEANPSLCGINVGDSNSDGKIGLEDVIYDLQVLSGMSSSKVCIPGQYCNFTGWTKYLSNPIFSAVDAGEWSVPLSGCTVLKDPDEAVNKYKMWYVGGQTTVGEGMFIGYATSTDGINWIPYSNNPIFSPGVSGSWDDDDVGNPYVIKEDSTYKMWYWGDDDLTGIDQIWEFGTSIAL